jgi:hypothetical protein
MRNYSASFTCNIVFCYKSTNFVLYNQTIIEYYNRA